MLDELNAPQGATGRFCKGRSPEGATAILCAILDEVSQAAWRQEVGGLSIEQREQLETWIEFHSCRVAERIAAMFDVMLGGEI